MGTCNALTLPVLDFLESKTIAFTAAMSHPDSWTERSPGFKSFVRRYIRTRTRRVVSILPRTKGSSGDNQFASDHSDRLGQKPSVSGASRVQKFKHHVRLPKWVESSHCPSASPGIGGYCLRLRYVESPCCLAGRLRLARLDANRLKTSPWYLL